MLRYDNFSLTVLRHWYWYSRCFMRKTTEGGIVKLTSSAPTDTASRTGSQARTPAGSAAPEKEYGGVLKIVNT